jgi:hypothetical protein
MQLSFLHKISKYKDDIVFLLTVDVELENLADGGRDAVLCHAHVRSHLAPRDAVQEQHVTPHLHTSNIFIYLFSLF